MNVRWTRGAPVEMLSAEFSRFSASEFKKQKDKAGEWKLSTLEVYGCSGQGFLRSDSAASAVSLAVCNL